MKRRNEAGLSLVEVIIVIALVGVIIAAFAGALSQGILGSSRVDERATAANLARSQIEDIKAQPYIEPPEYTVISAPAGYSITIDGSIETPGFLEVIRVTVSKDEDEETLLEVTAYKVNMGE